MTGVHDFDFLVGDWDVRHRRLKRRLVGEWIEFVGPASARKILDGLRRGLGDIDENRINEMQSLSASVSDARF